MIRLVPLGFGVVGAIVSQLDGTPTSYGQYGFAGLLGLVLWWMTHNLSDCLKDVRDAVRANTASHEAATANLSKRVDNLADSIRGMPCERVHELEKILAGRVANGAAKEKANT